jgi:hypothetical protein
MCTVTIVPRAGGYRLLCNRDERRARLRAVVPRPWPAGNGTAIFPVDPQGGGTWIGANDAGLAMALLNRTDDPGRVPAGRSSRGLIIPPLLRHEEVDAAVRAAALIDPSRFAPFRLVVVQTGRCGIVSSDGAALAVEFSEFDTPLMLTSSSLGDRRVDAPRRRLFERLVLRRPRGWIDGQRTFHRHRWRSRPEASVTMERADARTVSRTLVDVSWRTVTVRYEALDGDTRAGRTALAGAA